MVTVFYLGQKQGSGKPWQQLNIDVYNVLMEAVAKRVCALVNFVITKFFLYFFFFLENIFTLVHSSLWTFSLLGFSVWIDI